MFIFIILLISIVFYCTVPGTRISFRINILSFVLPLETLFYHSMYIYTFFKWCAIKVSILLLLNISTGKKGIRVSIAKLSLGLQSLVDEHKAKSLVSVLTTVNIKWFKKTKTLLLMSHLFTTVEHFSEIHTKQNHLSQPPTFIMPAGGQPAACGHGNGILPCANPVNTRGFPPGIFHLPPPPHSKMNMADNVFSRFLFLFVFGGGGLQNQPIGE